MKTFLLVLAIAVLTFSFTSCSEETSSNSTTTYIKSKLFPSSYLPLSVGNKWVYSCTIGDSYDLGAAKTTEITNQVSSLWYDTNLVTTSIPQTFIIKDKDNFFRSYCYLDDLGNLITGSTTDLNAPIFRNEYYMINSDNFSSDYYKCNASKEKFIAINATSIRTSLGEFHDIRVCGDTVIHGTDTVYNYYYFSKGVGLVKLEEIFNGTVTLRWELASLDVK